MPPVLSADDVAPAFNAVLQAVANGELTPEEGVQVARILESQARVVGFEFGAPWQPDTKARRTACADARRGGGGASGGSRLIDRFALFCVILTRRTVTGRDGTIRQMKR